MNDQRLSLWPSLVFFVACGGGGGPAHELQDGSPISPDKAPTSSDQVPTSSDQPPPPPLGPPPGSTGGGGNTGGSCGAACADTAALGCETPQSECVAWCSAPVEVCATEARALKVCALGIYCSDDLVELDAGEIQTLQAFCYSEATAFSTCQNANDAQP